MNDIFLPQIADGEDKTSPFINCIRNNYRHLRKWAKRTQTDCFRLYDRELHHYPLAIDFYAGRFCVHYFSSKRAIEEPSIELQKEIAQALNSIFSAKPDSIYWRTRSRQKETRQYEKMESSQEFFTVYEYGVKFRVNLVDYLDTGLFLDHRETRQLVKQVSKEKRVLNLFAYTCSFSVQAAMAGASFTKSVDMSNTYTRWGRSNFQINTLPAKEHVILREDCLKFLDFEYEKYDVIVIDPPTISRSKKMAQSLFDIQEDHVVLISKALRLLNEDGILFFSTNARKFFLEESHFKNYEIREISQKTMPQDFRDKTIHKCWIFKKKNF